MLQLVEAALSRLEVHDNGISLCHVDHQVALDSAPHVARHPSDGLPVPRVGPLAFGGGLTCREHFTGLLELLLELLELVDQLDSALDVALRGLVDAGSAVVCVLGFTRRQGSLGLRDFLEISQIKPVLTAFEDRQAGVRPSFRGHVEPFI